MGCWPPVGWRRPVETRLTQLDLGALSSYNWPGCMFERAVAETNLGVLRIKQMRYQEADQLLSEVVALQGGYEGSPGQQLAATLRTLAQVREKERRLEDAAQLQKRADAIMAFR